MGHPKEVGDVVADALVDLMPQVEVMGIKRVVEVEHERVDMIEATGRGAGAEGGVEVMPALLKHFAPKCLIVCA